MKSIQLAFVSALALASSVAGAQEITISGDVEQSAELKLSPMSSVATGIGAKAKTEVNTVEGKVKVKGSLKQTTKLDKSPLSAVATGLGAEATTTVNKISSK